MASVRITITIIIIIIIIIIITMDMPRHSVRFVQPLAQNPVAVVFKANLLGKAQRNLRTARGDHSAAPQKLLGLRGEERRGEERRREEGEAKQSKTKYD